MLPRGFSFNIEGTVHDGPKGGRELVVKPQIGGGPWTDQRGGI